MNTTLFVAQNRNSSVDTLQIAQKIETRDHTIYRSHSVAHLRVAVDYSLPGGSHADIDSPTHMFVSDNA